MKIPFSLLPPVVVFFLARQILAIGYPLSKLMPGMRVDILQAGFEITPKEYASVTLVVAALNSLLLLSIMLLVGELANTNTLPIAAAVCIVVGAASFFSMLMYPKVISGKRIRALDENLIPALRQMLIELKSGVTLFQAMTSVDEGYGAVSVEFKRISDRINVGISETDALNEAGKRNPNPRFRRVLWQISNAITAGSDVVTELEATIDDLTRERMEDIHRYGQELNPWTMAYMMLTGVIPSLGLSIMTVILSFLNVSIPPFVFPGILVLIILFQLFFMNFVKSRRPMVD